MRDSSWADETFHVRHPTRPDLEIQLSSAEFQLLRRMRELDRGSHTVFILKTTRGRDGLHSFRVIENTTERS